MYGADKQKNGHLPDPAQVICDMQQDCPVRALQGPITRQSMVLGRGAEPLRLHVIQCEIRTIRHQAMEQDGCNLRSEARPASGNWWLGVPWVPRCQVSGRHGAKTTKIPNYPNLIAPIHTM